MIRFICVVVILVTFLIVTIPVFFVEWLIGKFQSECERLQFSAHRTVGI